MGCFLNKRRYLYLKKVKDPETAKKSFSNLVALTDVSGDDTRELNESV